MKLNEAGTNANIMKQGSSLYEVVVVVVVAIVPVKVGLQQRRGRSVKVPLTDDCYAAAV